TGETVRKRTIRESDLSDQIEEKLGDIKEAFAEKGSWLKENFQKLKKHLKKDSDIKVSIVEVSISIEDAIKGVKKKIEIVEPEGSRKVSVVISSGVRDGSVIRLRNKNDRNEDLVLIIRLASHPYLTIKSKGLIMEIPITINEAVAGAQIKVPGIDDAILLKVQPGTQSGTELRIKEQGILGKDGKKGDLFVRFLIMAPPEPNAALLKEKTSEIQKYYEQDIRADLPETIV
ncbi:MAG: J domain-containing protein, partial [bacterium]|nr:J domain-containing protein [bacterium]